MPIYEYQCHACGHQADILQKMSDPDQATCPNCHKDTFSRQLSAPNFHLKGTGWYVTDFKDKPKNQASNETPHKASSSDTSSDTKKKPSEPTN